MKFIRSLDRRLTSAIACLGLFLASALPAVFPIAVYAQGTATVRSITMSSSVANAAGSTYRLQFKADTALDAGGGAIVEFCTNSPLISLTCTHPTGLTVAGIGTTGSTTPGTASDFDSSGDHATIKWVSTGAISSGASVDVTFTNIHNPTAVGTFYARITTYKAANMSGANAYTAAETPGSFEDEGGVALATTQAIGVTAYVRESLTFCVSGSGPAPTVNCGVTSDPSMTLGELQGDGSHVLDVTKISTGTDYAQLSTNASQGAVVNLKSSTTGCGGLIRQGPSNCDIKPQATASTGDVTAGSALFGIKFGTVADATGTGYVAGSLLPSGSYGSSKYFLDYQVGDTGGVTGPYGSAFFNSGGAPVSNKNMPFTFGVSPSNATPAGIYTATLNLIATGTF